MANPRSFGKRASTVKVLPAPMPAPVPLPAEEPEDGVADFLFDRAGLGADDAAVDDEIEQWKRSRTHGVLRAWPQIALMASVCFGIGSVVLPAMVNDLVQWPLYLLTTASLCAGLAGSRKVRL